MNLLRIPPGITAPVGLVAQWALSRDHQRRPGTTALAVALAVPSLVTLVAVERRFRTAGTTTDPVRVDRASALVTQGPNAVSRNPIYLGFAGLLLANAIGRRSWPSMVIAAGFVALTDRVQIPVEEAALQAKFGDEYTQYRARVPRWIGPFG
ncbi:methyltransferase family protein [Kribbia dieselivorans]|uniref:methyltransferase family protein n=1 Tax=Kribbia dieselivorans TaxID=331526 RepID=UPI000839A0F6|nr:isoprenylcysteine carboxylmethyltransferase family protein [Kribbia dieselivorans]